MKKIAAQETCSLSGCIKSKEETFLIEKEKSYSNEYNRDLYYDNKAKRSTINIEAYTIKIWG